MPDEVSLRKIWYQ